MCTIQAGLVQNL